jgi:[NiFe] hydrogenase assembly HybE family chaperone
VLVEPLRGGQAPAGAGDPAALLEAAFERVARDRMAGMPLANPALRVRAVGFRGTSAGWLGALVTPWCMNLMLLAAPGTPWRAPALGERLRFALPGGEFDFTGGREDGVGEYLYCSLFSPMGMFADAETAEQTACEAVRLALSPPPAQPEPGPAIA